MKTRNLYLALTVKALHHQIRTLLITAAIPGLTLLLVLATPERPVAEVGSDQSDVAFAQSEAQSRQDFDNDDLAALERDPDRCRRRDARGKSGGTTGPCRAYPNSAGVAPPDFNGDGDIDVVVGVPLEDVGTRTSVGMVNILTVFDRPFECCFDFTIHSITQDTPNVLDTAEAADQFGAAVAPGHFNGDEFTDLAVAVPGEDLTFGGVAVSGAVHVFQSTQASTPGNAISVLMSNDRLINPGELATPTGVIPIIGNSLVWGDFDGDTFGDLAIEVRNLGNAAVIVLFGASHFDTERDPGLDPNFRETRIFNTLTQTDVVLAAGDFNGDGIHDLVIGSPREAVSGASQAGRIVIAVGTDQRVNTLTQVVTLDRGASAVANNRFGASLAPGDFNGSGQDDLAVGEPGADISGFNDAGRVHIFLGSAPDGILPGASSQSFSQSGAATPGEPEEGDRFAEALAAADLNGDGFEDLAVGVPFEDLSVDGANRNDAGAVNVFLGSGASLSTAGAHFWDQDEVQGGVSIGGRVEAGDRFGSAISAWRFRLNIGVPLENVDGGGTDVANAGAVNFIFGTSAVGNLLKVQEGSVAAQDAFGSVIY